MRQIISAGIGFGLALVTLNWLGIKPSLHILILATIGLLGALIANLIEIINHSIETNY